MNKTMKEKMDRCYSLWRAIVYKKYKGKCVKCGVQACDPHHVFPKGAYPMFKYNTLNGVMLCRYCHDLYHTKQDPDVIRAIIMALGAPEYEKLVEESRKVKWTSKEEILAQLEKEAKEKGILD